MKSKPQWGALYVINWSWIVLSMRILAILGVTLNPMPFYRIDNRYLDLITVKRTYEL